MSQMYGKIGENKPEYLLADPQDADMIAVPLKPKQGVVPRGMIAYRTATGQYAAAEEDDVTEENSLVVIDERVDTDLEATIAENARAFRAARLVRERVILKDADTLTREAELILRKQGLVFEPIHSAE